MLRTLDDLRARFAPAAERQFLGGLLDEAAPGAVIELEAGTYLAPAAIERSVTLRGDAARKSVIAGRRGQAALEVIAAGADVVLEHLVIRDAGDLMGAIAVRGELNRLVLRDCILFDNACPPDLPAGGAVSITSGSLRLERCLLWGNRGSAGGALSVRRVARLEAVSCLFVANTASVGGGAVWVDDGVRARLVNCTLVDDASDDPTTGYAVHVAAATGRPGEAELINTVIRAEDVCFGYAEMSGGKVSARACLLPPHAREYAPLSADPATVFGPPAFVHEGFPWALRPGARDGGDATAFDDPEAARDLFGDSLREGAGLARGAVGPVGASGERGY